MTTVAIPENPVLQASPEQMREIFHSRQSGLFDPEKIQARSVLVVGVGAVGSNAVYQLASQGIEHFTIVDPDEVGPENIFPAFYTYSQSAVGVPKVTAIEENLYHFYGGSGIDFTMESIHGEFDPTQRARHDIVIVGTDSMATRKRFWEKCMFRWNLWIDVRIGQLDAIMYALTPDNEADRQSYTNSLGLGAADLPCGQKATSFVTKGWVPWRIGYTVSRFVHNLPFKFYVTWSGETDIMVDSGMPEPAEE